MQREFDVERLRRVQKVRGITKKGIAGSVGLTAPRVSAWFAGDATPPPEMLPALASALDEDIDDLFPRNGQPDLRDLRCDAGIRLKDVPGIIGTKSASPVKDAERGMKRLEDGYAESLAARCRVSIEELRTAEGRSFGEEATTPVSPHEPTTLAGKITRLLAYLPEADRPSDAMIAEAICTKAGVNDLIRPSQVRDLRTGRKSVAETLDQVPEQVLYEGLGVVFSVPPHTFQSDEEIVSQVLETVRFLAENRGRVDLQLRGSAALSTRMLARLNDLVAEARSEDAGSQ